MHIKIRPPKPGEISWLDPAYGAKLQAQNTAITFAGFTGPRVNGTRCCLCRECGLLFGGETTFKTHRYGDFVDEHPHYGRACRSEKWLLANGYERNDRGWWHKPMTEKQLKAFRRLKGAT